METTELREKAILDWAKVPFGADVRVWNKRDNIKRLGKFLGYNENGLHKYCVFVDINTPKVWDYCEPVEIKKEIACNRNRIRYSDFKQAIEYNADLCTTIAMEECAELVQAISKAKRGKLDRSNLIEEIVDVYISVHWLLELYDISADEIDRWFEFKTNRIVTRLNKGTFK